MNSANSSGTIVFDKDTNTDTTFYTGKKLPIYAAGDTKWYVDGEGNISLEVAEVKYGNGEIVKLPFSQKVANDVATYYGEKVLNYKTGDTTIDNQIEWQIFYADTSNIYLIATDYVHYDLLPTKKVTTADSTETVYALNKGDTDCGAYFTNMLPAYNGSEDITEEKIQALNSSYHEYLRNNNNAVSKNDNMKAVAYMLDTSETVWGTFAGEYADYAIGGPTIEMLMKSYNQKYSVDYRAQATSINGYQVSSDGGEKWDYYFYDMLNNSDTQYVIKATNKAYGMWLASSDALGTDSLFNVDFYGYMNTTSCDNYPNGFRPLVCLNSNVTLKAVTGGYEIE